MSDARPALVSGVERVVSVNTSRALDSLGERNLDTPHFAVDGHAVRLERIRCRALQHSPVHTLKCEPCQGTSQSTRRVGLYLADLQYCHLASGFLTQFSGLGTYLVPKVDVEVSTTFRSNPGVQLAANYNVRPLSWRSRSAARHQAASRMSPSI
jgi:hypothetical protein